MSFTPGPWKLYKYGLNVVDETGRVTANCGGYASNVDPEEVNAENRANAHLISASPDMYHLLDSLCDTVSPEDEKVIYEVLRKADGRE